MSKARKLSALAATVVLLIGPPAASKAVGSNTAAPTPSALASRTLSLNEIGHLRLTSRHGFTLNERGTVSGTIAGAIYVHLTVVSSRRVVAEVNIYPRGGSISAHATASYSRGSTAATFTGSLSIDRGTGTYAHARGSGLSFSGTILRSNEAITVHVNGKASD